MARLRAIDTDLGRAIVTLAEQRTGRRVPAIQPAELASYGNHSVIVVMPLKSLKRLPGVELVPIGNGRALISLEHPLSIAEFELQLHDAIDQVPAVSHEREPIEVLSKLLREARRSQTVVLKERTIIVLQAKRQRTR